MSRRKPRSLNMQTLQVLEDRALLAANLTDGVLTVEGTDDADIIYLRKNDETVFVKQNGETTEFPAADVTQIVINANAGDDKVVLNRRFDMAAEIDGGEGEDKIKGGKMGDTLVGGDGADKLYGGGGADNLEGGEGNDKLYGARGSDSLFGGNGDDVVRGGKGADLLEGGDGDDSLAGDRGDDTLNAGAGNDELKAGSGSNQLFGEDGDDTLYGNSNNDTLDGGLGENTINDDAIRIAEAVDGVFERLDTNTDDLITEDEITGGEVGMFWSRIADQLDTNEDDAIDRDELTAAVDRMASRFSSTLGRVRRRFSRFRRGV